MKILRLSDFEINDGLSLRDKAILSTLKFTGIRCGELLTIKIEDLDLANRTLKVFDSKKKTYFIVPICLKLCDLLREYIGFRKSGLLFASRNKGHEKMCRTNIEWIVHKFNPHLSPRNFRHFFARNWVLNKGDLVSLQAILRHTSIQMTSHYVDMIRFVEENAIVQKEYERIFNN